MNYDAIIVSVKLVVALLIFMSDRVRPDAFALMPAGCYRFSDYLKVGGPLSIIVVVLTAFFLTEYYP